MISLSIYATDARLVCLPGCKVEVSVRIRPFIAKYDADCTNDEVLLISLPIA